MTEASRRVAIIGGGCAALSAAWELTRPEQGGRFEVTVYQMGWRLGGKGASGRGSHGRIEEHGLHVWLGFYENAFRLLREAYDELGRDPARCPVTRLEDAFLPAPSIALADWDPERDWHVWQAEFPEFPGRPGTPLERGATDPFGPSGSLLRSVELMRTLFEVAFGPWPRPSLEDPLDVLLVGARRVLGAGTAAADEVMSWVMALARAVFAAPSTHRLVEAATDVAVGLLDRLRVLARALPRPPGADPVAHANAGWAFELVVAALRGVLADRAHVHPDGFASLDDHDFAEWLHAHGASEAAVTSSFLRGLYSLMFAYEGGDERRPACAAGACLRGVLRMFGTYRGHIFYKMVAGMGDIVFAPLYEALVRRGVRFEFFHRLERLSIEGWGGAPFVRSLDLTMQAQLREQAYRPLVDVRGLPCWPAEPDWSQLVDGDRLRAAGARFERSDDPHAAAALRLEVGRDFDFVVLGVGLGEVPRVAGEIVERDPRWAEMVRRMGTAATCALQLWMRPSVEQLGWSRGSVTLTGFTSPYDTWSDMSHLLPMEDFPARDAPRSLAYFCNVLSDARLRAFGEAHPGALPDELVLKDSLQFMNESLPALWPRAADERGFRFPLLYPTSSAPQPDLRLEGQFMSCNVEPTDRYTLCLPGTPALRISPLDPTYRNLTVCGDWTANGLDLGCVEAAVMSGQLASHALSRRPALEDIIGYDHL